MESALLVHKSGQGGLDVGLKGVVNVADDSLAVGRGQLGAGLGCVGGRVDVVFEVGLGVLDGDGGEKATVVLECVLTWE